MILSQSDKINDTKIQCFSQDKMKVSILQPLKLFDVIIIALVVTLY